MLKDDRSDLYAIDRSREAHSFKYVIVKLTVKVNLVPKWEARNRRPGSSRGNRVSINWPPR